MMRKPGSKVEPMYADIARRVREARERAGLSQYDLADLMGRTRASVQQIERGGQRIYIHTLVEIAKVLGVSFGELTGL